MRPEGTTPWWHFYAQMKLVRGQNDILSDRHNNLLSVRTPHATLQRSDLNI